MSTGEPKKKLIVDEDWKSQVQAEREAAKQPAAQKSAPPEPAEAYPIPEASFSMLVTTLATQAMVALGQARLPNEEEAGVNLPFAKHCIDTLDILEQKTKGQLTTDESQLLTQFLYQLRMLFVAVKNQQSQPAAHPRRGATITARTPMPGVVRDGSAFQGRPCDWATA